MKPTNCPNRLIPCKYLKLSWIHSVQPMASRSSKATITTSKVNEVFHPHLPNVQKCDTRVNSKPASSPPRNMTTQKRETEYGNFNDSIVKAKSAYTFPMLNQMHHSTLRWTIGMQFMRAQSILVFPSASGIGSATILSPAHSFRERP